MERAANSKLTTNPGTPERKQSEKNYKITSAGGKIVGGIIATVASAGAASPWLIGLGVVSGSYSAATGAAELTLAAADKDDPDLPDTYMGALGRGGDAAAGNEKWRVGEYW